jgi:hypothetical protein
MTVPDRRSLVFVLLAPAVLLVCGAFASATWVVRHAANLWNHSSERAADDARARALANFLADIKRRRDARAAAATEVVAGRRTLLEAALLFRQADRASPSFCPHAFELAYCGDTDEERYCRAVIDFIRWQRKDDPARAAIVHRLEGELQDLLRRGTLGPGQFNPAEPPLAHAQEASLHENPVCHRSLPGRNPSARP